MFSKKHYEFLAKLISQSGDIQDVEEFVYVLAKALEKDNPQFNKKEFLRAAIGIEE